MDRMAKVSVSELKAGDRFYYSTDRTKAVMQIIETADKEIMCCPSMFVGTHIENKKTVPIRTNVPVIFLRSANN